ncbi:hypothetical protein MMAN_54940 [Mycobacterium mantenii]|uniref:Glucose/Sorbosone dehydrogenase domain-containing protein n=1 Tax=Mycobacterium mantenii TaxID=560555 RepID=A0ABN6AEC6_MYCNT|nr:hypothetical protein MMAN_54940 [Mycobacterium mantenii]
MEIQQTDWEPPLYLSDFRPGSRTYESCGKALSPTVPRNVGAMKDAIIDPTGNIYFLMNGSNDLALYQANPADPSQPKKLPFKGAFLGKWF